MATAREQGRPIAFITGATRGIGYEIAKTLAGDHHLIIGGSNDTAVEVAKEFPSAEAFVADLDDIESLQHAVEKLELDRLDVLVHCAGVVSHLPVTETTHAQWQHAFNVNFFAVAELTRLMVPALTATPAATPTATTGSGTLPAVVSINSGAGFHSSVGYGPYASTKFALRAYTDALREEYRGKLRVISIHPGKTHSDMQREIQDLRGNAYERSEFVDPASIAQAVRFALDTPQDAMVENLTIRPINGK
ncbi:SDR family oxidoreductase [Corynebacterium sp. 320]|uniref:SDR family oxidoreductase n=1 Tax=Corynebacterium TaxID=1716 RepID=UPI00125CCF3C|nr:MULTISPECIES: SDR family oxidoreductase [Corynebacterium]KAB1504040.1 SDR family oxidoreductase [Corynebacterium sp. 320]KAB1552861.1 SDR family oxidoreductase [Corynebacterium sp. 321]KAB1553921.1 SDR family oxidoreductase [Corynebacterium sp. 319]KAB3528176.1 SDR family oxidoreductase [Corynebacterium sp. 250]KAB3540336.1 SDR family oxidoreductase [Corynebacterium sp. 366]